jgi:putative nucleotidyltransferase with HDIG domain
MTDVMIHNKVKQVVSNIRNLPTPPIVFNQIQNALSQANVSAAHVAAILAEDPAMSAKVLKLTNSAFYGLAREVESVKQAVVVIGLEAVRNLVLSASVLEMFTGDTIDPQFQEQHWRHSLATASASRLLVKAARSREMFDSDAAFSAGLLHDIGKMVIACYLPKEFKEIQAQRAVEPLAPDFVLEEKVLGYTHAQIGGYLATHWKLPGKLSNSIIFHHKPQMCPLDDLSPFIVHLANYVAKKTFYHKTENHLVGTIEEGTLEKLVLTDYDLDQLTEQLRNEYLKSETFMQMAGIKIAS